MTTTIGLVGVGVMGGGMGRNLMKAGFPLTVYTRTKAKAKSLLQEGAHWADSPKELAATSDLVITMVGYPKDVEDVYCGENGIFAGKHGGIVIDRGDVCAELDMWPQLLKTVRNYREHTVELGIHGL